jgi:hypothetical protein
MKQLHVLLRGGYTIRGLFLRHFLASCSVSPPLGLALLYLSGGVSLRSHRYWLPIASELYSTVLSAPVLA